MNHQCLAWLIVINQMGRQMRSAELVDLFNDDVLLIRIKAVMASNIEVINYYANNLVSLT